jgi:hypothetical protein
MTIERIYFRAACAFTLIAFLTFGTAAGYAWYDAWRKDWASSALVTEWIHKTNACTKLKTKAACDEAETARYLDQRFNAERLWAFEVRRKHTSLAAIFIPLPFLLFYVGRWAATGKVRPFVPK